MKARCDLFSGGFWDFLKHRSFWVGGPDPINLTKQKFRRSGSLECQRILTVTWGPFSFLLHFPFNICSLSSQEAALFWCHTLPGCCLPCHCAKSSLFKRCFLQLDENAEWLSVSPFPWICWLEGKWHMAGTTTATTKWSLPMPETSGPVQNWRSNSVSGSILVKESKTLSDYLEDSDNHSLHSSCQSAQESVWTRPSLQKFGFLNSGALNSQAEAK